MIKVPPLAGICSYDEAAKPGYSVDETVTRLVRYAWFSKAMMELSLYWLNPTPEWEIKEALSQHAYIAAEHAAMLRGRVSEMRNPAPDMNASPDPAIDRFLAEMLTASDTEEKLFALTLILYPAMRDAYKAHLDALNPLIDYPTRRILRIMLADLEEICEWASVVAEELAGEVASNAGYDEWIVHLEAYLDAAGGIAGDKSLVDNLPAPRADPDEPFVPDYMPQRDDRFTGQWNFTFPPHEVSRMPDVSAEERTLALMCKRTLEMDVPEAMARMIAEAQNQPWEFYVDMCRQLWDEARHAMMGSVYFEQIGVDWRAEIPLHPGFAIRLNQALNPQEAHAVLYAIEQSLMPATTGKKYEWTVADEAANPLAKLFQDYDWADEVLHVRIGRTWGMQASGMPRAEYEALGLQKAVESEAYLDSFKDRAPQVNWWPAFVERVLGQPSATIGMDLQANSDPVYRRDE